MSNQNDFIIENGVLTKYVGAGGDVLIPDDITKIGSAAFQYCNNLTSIILPEKMTDIGDFAFDCCTALRSIYFPKALIHIGNHAFNFCTGLTEVSLPDGLQKIECSAFEGCNSLTSISIPDSVTKIGQYAFQNCKDLEFIKLPAKLTVIDYGTFIGCDNLKTIDLPAVVTCIMFSSFEGCASLKDVTIQGTIPEIKSGAFKGAEKICIHIPSEPVKTKETLSGELARGDIDVSEEALAWLILYQRSPLWKAWKNRVEFQNPTGLLQIMIDLIRTEDPFDKKLAAPVADFILKYYKHLAAKSIREALALFDGKKCKEVDALRNDGALQSYLAGETVKKHPAEELAEKLLNETGLEPKAASAVSQGVHYSESERICDKSVLTAILSAYILIWNNGEGFVRSCPEADEIADMLNRRELSEFLEKLIRGSGYKPYMLAWARLADDESVERMTADFKTRLRATAGERYRAEAMKKALSVNDTRAAMLFFDRIGELSVYAAKRGTTAMELRDTAMLPDFGFDADGIKRYDVDGNVLEITVDNSLNCVIYSPVQKKTLRSFPNKGVKAEKAAADYAALRKEIKSFIRLRREQLCRMHISGDAVSLDLWTKVYLQHPVIKLLSEHIVWMDSDEKTFTVHNGTVVDASLQPTEPHGKIRIAHVLDLPVDVIDMWRHTLTKIGRAELFDQMWEPIIEYNAGELKNRYKGIVISSKARNSLKTALKRRGIDVRAGEMEREYNGSSYWFSNENDLYFGSSLKLHYEVDEDSGILTFGIASLECGATERQLNAVLLELDRISAIYLIQRDDASVSKVFDRFTLAQITEFIAAAQEANANNVLALLLDYKNAHFADYDPMDEFTLEW